MMEDPPAIKKTRFLVLACIVLAMSLGVATWTWMAYSYCWDVTARLQRRYDDGKYDTLPVGSWSVPFSNSYVSVQGKVVKTYDVHRNPSGVVEGKYVVLDVPGVEDSYPADMRGVHPRLDPSATAQDMVGSDGTFVGRVRFGGGGQLEVDTTASRLHIASILGLAWGALVVIGFAAFMHLRTKTMR